MSICSGSGAVPSKLTVPLISANEAEAPFDEVRIGELQNDAVADASGGAQRFRTIASDPDGWCASLCPRETRTHAVQLHGLSTVERAENTHKLFEIFDGLDDKQWSGEIVAHKYMGPLPAFFYPAFQLLDYGVHSWDVCQGTGRAHGLSGEAADLLYHLLVVLEVRRVPFTDVLAELQSRMGTSGLAEKAARNQEGPK